MHEWVEKLLILQKKDMRLHKLQGRIDNTPAEKDSIDAWVSGAQQKTEGAKTRKIELQLALKKIELEVDSLSAEITEIRKKSSMIKDNEEYRATMKMIDDRKHKISQQEDLELEIMEKMESDIKENFIIDKFLRTAESRVEEMKLDLDKRIKNCSKQIDNLRKEREEALEAVEPRIARRYTRLFQKKAKRSKILDNRIIVPLRDNGICDYCHMNATAQVKMNARKKEPVCCENCGSIVYWME